MDELYAIVRKEWKEIFAGDGRRGGTFRILVIVFVMGIFLPSQFGATWLSSRFALAMGGWIPIILIVAVVADSFAGERERHTLETLLASRLSDRTILFGKLLAATAYGFGITLATLLVSGIAVNLTHDGGFTFFSAGRVGGILLLAALSAVFAATGGVLVSLRAATVRQAQQTLSIAAMLVFFIPTIGLPALPSAARSRMLLWFASRDAASVFALLLLVILTVDLLLLAACLARFRRDRLILS